MGMFVNYFFAGFILGKIPFRLSPSFRPMLQRGIDLPSLDVTYFTSLSYYILLLFGLQGVFRIIFRCRLWAEISTPLSSLVESCVRTPLSTVLNADQLAERCCGLLCTQ